MKFCTDIHVPLMMSPINNGEVSAVPLKSTMWLMFLVLSEIILQVVGWIAMKFCTDIHGHKRKYLNYLVNLSLFL